jgi:hypothetical protein
MIARQNVGIVVLPTDPVPAVETAAESTVVMVVANVTSLVGAADHVRYRSEE